MTEDESRAVNDPPPASATGPQLLEHDYDGIQEFDNPLPGWWRVTFYASIVFAVVYWIWFHAGGPGISETEQYLAERKAYDENVAAFAAATGSIDEGTLAAGSRDPRALEHGKTVFAKYCTPCHTENGRGLIGPNLTDDFQKHGHTRADLFATVSGGAPGTAMIAWSATLRPEDIIDVVSYVSTLRGTNVPGGKPPEGERVGGFE